jgi:hypothetical protein
MARAMPSTPALSGPATVREDGRSVRLIVAPITPLPISTEPVPCSKTSASLARQGPVQRLIAPPAIRDTLGGKPTPAELAEGEEGAIDEPHSDHPYEGQRTPHAPPPRGSFAF